MIVSGSGFPTARVRVSASPRSQVFDDVVQVNTLFENQFDELSIYQ
jgi:hypothetical protein